jgi:hypothetical protein
MSRDMAVAFARFQELYAFQERRIAVLEQGQQVTFARDAAHGAILEERKRDGDASREHSVDIARMRAELDQLTRVSRDITRLMGRVSKVERGGDSVAVARSTKLSLGSGAMSVALFVATVIFNLIGLFQG